MKNAIYGFLIGASTALLASACATNPFPYNFYTVDLKDQKLQGPTSGDYPDLPLSVCEATAVSQSPCVAMMTDQYFQLQENYENLQNELVACQKAAQ